MKARSTYKIAELPKQKWPKGHIVQVGNKTTKEAAKEWEGTKHKS